MALSSSTEDIHGLIAAVNSAAAKLTGNIESHADQRKALLSAAQRLTVSLETPSETAWRILWQPHVNAALTVAVDMGLLELIVSDSRGWTTAKELSAHTGYSCALIVRTMRVLLSVGLLAEQGPDSYRSTELTRYLATPAMRCGVRDLYDTSYKSLIKIPEYLAANGYQNPEDGANGAFQYAFDTKLRMFDWLKQRPKELEDFNIFMSAHRAGRPLWFTFFPVEKSLFEDLQSSELLVDVGGGFGHDLFAFRAAYPDHPGRLILQDLPETIEGVSKTDSGVELMSHDFFTPQPIKGAKAYYFSAIFHDWPDAQCSEILRNTAAAMTKGYSKLLINDYALPDTQCPMPAACMDFNMMALFTSMERTKEQWHKLLDRADLEIVKFWTYEGGEFDGLIEARLKETS